MTKQEVNKLLALMRANYSASFKGMGQQDKYLLLNTWTLALCDLDAGIVTLAAMQIISKSKWMPTVAEVRAQCAALYAEASLACCDLGFDELPEWKKKAYLAVTEKTARLRGGDGNTGLSLSDMMRDPQMAALATGREPMERIGSSEAWSAEA